MAPASHRTITTTTTLKHNKHNNTMDNTQAPSHFKPGKTINKHERHFVVHDYHDYANEPDDPAKCPIRRRKGGVTTPFPVVLHRIMAQIEADGYSEIFGWQPHGRCFVIFQPKAFVATIMPKYFKLGKLSSFQRQLNLYGFNRITRGKDATGYYHEYFLRDREYLAKRILRKRIKGTKIKGATNPDLEPDFYGMPPVGPHPDPNAAPVVVSSDEHSSAHASETDDGSSDHNNNNNPTSTQGGNDNNNNNSALCNFVFPKFLDPVDELLQQESGGELSSPADLKVLPGGVKDWELQEAILGQYLIFDEEEDNFEAV